MTTATVTTGVQGRRTRKTAGAPTTEINVIMVLDAGNENTKITVDCKNDPLIIPTALLRKRLADMPDPENLPIESFQDLADTPQYYLFGKTAIATDDARCIRFYRRVDSKITHGHLMLKSAVAAMFPQYETVNVSLLVSCNDLKTHKDDLRAAYDQSFTIWCANSAHSTTINVNYLGGANEGQAVAKMHDYDGPITVFDIGGGDVAITTFTAKGRIATRNSVRFGAKDLFASLMDSQVLKDQLHKANSNTLLSSARIAHAVYNPLSDGTMWYRVSNAVNSPTIDITDIYSDTLADWVANLNDTILSEAYADIQKTELAIGIGGGWLLPGLKDAIASHGFDVTSVEGDPVSHNANTLMNVAKRLHQRQRG